jgi:TonB family protein
MPSPAWRVQIFLHFQLSILAALAPSQSVAPASELPRIHMKQEQLGCNILNAVNPVYPREARLASIEGIVKLTMVIAGDGTVADLQAVSGEALFRDSTIEAVRQWRFQLILLNGRPTEADVALSFIFRIQYPPKPAYLHLTNGDVIRADEVREFTDRIEYTVGHRTRHLPPDSITDINACGRLAHPGQPGEGDCVPGGGLSFTIRAFPLLPADKGGH